jgi:hypothetical protein
VRVKSCTMLTKVNILCGSWSVLVS